MTEDAWMNLVCLDLEGVLVPEIWIAFAEAAGIPDLERTTRDEPHYPTLMQYRLDILAKHGCRLSDVQATISTLKPLPGALEFVDWLKAQTRLIILSDTFSQFAGPLMEQLGHPTLFCHDLIIDENDRIVDYRLRLDDQKRQAVEAFQRLNFKVIAGGDSYNDLSMLKAADRGILFRPPESLLQEHPEMPVAADHAKLRAEIETAMAELG